MPTESRAIELGSSLEDRIGNTPLIRLDRLLHNFNGELDGITLLAKAEWYNPGGSIKDRAVAAMLRDARERGKLGPGKTLLDATSGNTGIALAMLGAARGIPVLLTMPSNVSPERKHILKAYGAQVEWTRADESSDGAIRRAREIAGNDPERYCYLDQYSNPANWRAHYETTAPEIWRQTEGRVSHFVAGMGTSGTFMGAARRLKELNPRLVAASMQPASAFHGLEGLKHMATSIVPSIYDPHFADRSIEVETEAAYAMCKQLAREEGVLVGISAAGNVVAALEIARGEAAAGRSAVIVTVLPDSADKYLSDRFWEEA
jgi:S-sulfo-L-cysteine synthase (O-acetyl-L-serine-dependent)